MDGSLKTMARFCKKLHFRGAEVSCQIFFAVLTTTEHNYHHAPINGIQLTEDAFNTMPPLYIERDSANLHTRKSFSINPQ